MRIRPSFLAGYIEHRGHHLHPRARGQGKQAGRRPSTTGQVSSPPGGDRRLVALSGPAGGDLNAPADQVQQQIHPGQRVLHAEPAAHHLGDPGQRPALVLIPARIPHNAA